MVDDKKYPYRAYWNVLVRDGREINSIAFKVNDRADEEVQLKILDNFFDDVTKFGFRTRLGKVIINPRHIQAVYLREK